MINYRFGQQVGMALIEVLIAILVFSITILSLLAFQSSLVTHFKINQDRLKAEQIAFQLLESYPLTDPKIIVGQREYHLISQKWGSHCVLVKAYVSPLDGESIVQQRLFC